MLYAISVQLGEALAVRKVPYRVVYGPEPMGQGITSPHIVIERDRATGDRVIEGDKPPQRNPKLIFARYIGATCLVFAKSTAASAIVADHERVADQVIDQVLVALRTVVKGRKNTLGVGAGHLLTDEELAARKIQNWPGVVYEQSFVIDRGVTDGAYAGETTAAYGTTPALGEATAGGATGWSVSTTTDTSDSPGTSETLPSGSTR